MNKFLFILASTLMVASACAQPKLPQASGQENKENYQAFVYIDDKLAQDIATRSNELLNSQTNQRKGLGTDLLNSLTTAGRGIASGYVTSIVDAGVNALVSLFTKNARDKKAWQEAVAAENKFETTIQTVQDLSDFYKELSFDSPLDPKGMCFNGIGCMKTDNQGDTTFYLSCHINRNKIDRIIKHSKFELVIDTLIIIPTRCDLPNTRFDIPFTFEQRKNFRMSIDMKISSSWVNVLTQPFVDQELGHFNVEINVDPTKLDSQGRIHYVRMAGTESDYAITGESFIIPRSFMYYRDGNEAKDCWGTGQYKVAVTLTETCDITDAYSKVWKEDYKMRKNMLKAAQKQGNQNFLAQANKFITKQEWNQTLQQWIVTMVKAPTQVISNKISGQQDQMKMMQMMMQMGGSKSVAGQAGSSSQGQPGAGQYPQQSGK